MLYALILGYFVSLVIGHFVTKIVIDFLWKDSKIEKGKVKTNLPAVLGFIERFLYTGSFLLNQPAFIALVLGLKGLGEWKTSRRDGVIQRQQIQVFLIGAFISLIFGIAGAIIVKFYLKPNYLQELLVS